VNGFLAIQTIRRFQDLQAKAKQTNEDQVVHMYVERCLDEDGFGNVDVVTEYVTPDGQVRYGRLHVSDDEQKAVLRRALAAVSSQVGLRVTKGRDRNGKENRGG